MSKEHLKPFSERSPEEARKIRSKGGVAKAEAIAKRKKMREWLSLYLEHKADGSDKSNAEMIIIKTIEAMVTNPSAKELKTLCEILGEMKSTTEIEGGNITINVNSDTLKQEDLDKLL